MAIDKRRISKELAQAVNQASKEAFKNKITNSDLKSIGDIVIDRMKSQISKGISPIAGDGRFPEYKSRTAAKTLRNQAKRRGAAARSAPNQATAKRLRKEAKAFRQAASKSQRRGYPDNLSKAVLAKTGKKARPVNLKLFGDFLDSLETKVRNRVIEIGFFDPKQAVKEQGHREGANGQYLRPIIPTKAEKFNAAIDAEILKAIDRVLKRRL